MFLLTKKAFDKALTEEHGGFWLLKSQSVSLVPF